MLIDPPTNVLSSVAAAQAWLDRVRTADQTDSDVIAAVRPAERWDALAKSLHEDDDKIRYALRMTANVALMLYEVEFRLKRPVEIGRRERARRK